MAHTALVHARASKPLQARTCRCRAAAGRSASSRSAATCGSSNYPNPRSRSSSATGRCRCRPTSAASPTRATARATRACSRASTARWRRPPPACISTTTLLAALEARGVQRAFVTLHVGAGTFQPVRTDAVGAHVMHAEFVEVSADDLRGGRGRARARRARHRRRHDRGARARERRGRRRARALSAAIRRCSSCRDSDFRVVDAMLTNFHLPESTLLMLVSAFAGREAVLAAYRHAVARQYRFFSYGDAMFVTPRPSARARNRMTRRIHLVRHASAPRAAGASSSRTAWSRRRPSCPWAPTARSRR